MVYNQKAKVYVKFNDIADIDAGKEDLRIKARVIRMWKVPAFSNPSEFSSLEVILVDEKCGKIHATVGRQLIYMFEGKLEESKVYEIYGFSIFPQTGFYRPTLHPYKLLFQLKIKVRPSESSAIPEFGKTLGCSSVNNQTPVQAESWEPPPLNVTKINVDAGCFKDGFTCWGLVVFVCWNEVCIGTT
ncbi:hypothetical protein TSUD_340940 [Trifolium subterraneum]|uniref:Replication protein A 70 kDa DNA-binding subunit B/D first OB fold domain-containing protein n=1 Tax=Trifolium subterraneum TaxID=3900 RepID=A0A2Z6LJC4_TRISU|nr:hypothetical protein TSUD_340940 [Trifolium subterraneum]